MTLELVERHRNRSCQGKGSTVNDHSCVVAMCRGILAIGTVAALALRSMHDNFGSEAEQLLRKYVPQDSLDEALLRRFRLLDELF
jgi:hypothetical protein